MFLRRYATETENAFARKLSYLAALSEDDLAAIAAVFSRGDEQMFDSTKQRIGVRVESGFSILTKGFACRCRGLADGTRQILSFILPGDTLEPFGRWSRTSVSSVSEVFTVGTTTIRTFGPKDDPIPDLITRPSVARALWRASMQQENLLYERIVTLGRRSSEARLAALLCELYCRFDAVGLVDNGTMEFGLTQQEIADAIGISAVHVNRVFKVLRTNGLIEVERHKIKVLDLAGLSHTGQWDSDYLLLRMR